mgnify:CR=1 FL=1
MFNNNLGWVSFSTASGYLVYGYNGSSWSYQCALEIPVKQFSFVDPLDGWALGLLIGHPSSGPPNMIAVSGIISLIFSASKRFLSIFQRYDVNEITSGFVP